MRIAVVGWLVLMSCRSPALVAAAGSDASSDAVRLCDSDRACADGMRCIAGVCGVDGELDATVLDAAVAADARQMEDPIDASSDLDAGEPDAAEVIARIDLAGYQLRNAENAAQVATLPTGTILEAGDIWFDP